jgi:DNA-binding NarL/FixJ family response regulator
MPVICPKAFTSIVKQIIPNETAILKDVTIPDFYLTDKEIKIVQLIVDGKSNKEIAVLLNFSEGSVKNLITGILDKLKLKDRTQLAVFAVKNNLV